MQPRRRGTLNSMKPTEAAQVGAAPASEHTTTKQHLRGSSLLLVGRLVSLLTNFGVQVLIVRYLSKADYGAFAYALSVVSMGTSLAGLGMSRGVNRFVPIYQEQRDYGSMFGTIVLALGTVVGFGLALVVLVFGLQGLLTRSVASDPLSVGLLLILISLVPIQALDNLFQGMAATFVGARPIFFRRHVLGPAFKLAAVLLVIGMQGSVHLLAACYLVAGAIGVGIYVIVLYRALKKQGLLAKLSVRRITLPVRRIFGFSIPLLSTDILLTLKMTMAVVLLEYFRGPQDVAELRAVWSIAGLCMVVFESLKFLFTPLAARLFARNDEAGLSDLYWRSAMWVTVLTFPVFAVCFLLAEPVTVLLFGSRYADAGILLSVLAGGYYFNAALGMNIYTLQVYARIRYITCVNVATALIGLGSNLWLIQLFGALGAALATAGTLVVYGLLNFVGVLWRTGIGPLQWRHLKVYATVAVAVLGLLALQVFASPPVPITVAALAITSLLLLRINRSSLAISDTFPELSRIPVLRNVLGLRHEQKRW